MVALDGLGTSGFDDDGGLNLTPFEAEHFINCIEPLGLEDVGTRKFLEMHEKVDKLSHMVQLIVQRDDIFCITFFVQCS